MSVNMFDTVALPINKNIQPPEFEFGIAGRQAYDYYWIYVVAGIFAFFNAAGIGANDVANAFATSVGSKTLKMWQAVVIGMFMEFFGAYLLGARVTATIRSNITNVEAFNGHDDLLMFGMMIVNLVTGTWLAVATLNEMTVSTTHSVIGAIVGFSLCSPGGASAVAWKDLGLIIGFWFIAPICSGLIAAFFYATVRGVILRNENSFDRTFVLLPILVGLTVFINCIFIIFKGGILKNDPSGKPPISNGEAVGISVGVGAGCGLLVFLFLGPMARRWIENQSDEEILRFAHEAGNITLTEAELKAIEEAKVAGEAGSADSERAIQDSASADLPIDEIRAMSPTPTPSVSEKKLKTPQTSNLSNAGSFMFRKMDKMFQEQQDHINNQAKATTVVSEMHATSEKFPLRTEIAFSFLQVFTACFASFAHGANDVSNAIGPFSAVVSIYNSGVGAASKSAPVQDWVLLMGGAGIVVGLALYGHVIMAAMGVKMTRITPARGFCIELTAALVIVTGSFLGMPLSSTHCCVGAIVGVGLTESSKKSSVNWKFLGKTFSGWILTLVVTASMCAALFSFVTFSPSQIYPLSQHNCMFMYGELYNTTAGQTIPTITTDAQGTVSMLVGYPATGTFEISV